MDKKSLSLLGMSLLGLGVVSNCTRSEQTPKENIDPGEILKPEIELDNFKSNRYKISFDYPKGWQKNPRYEDKYEGKTGFFEIGDFTGNNENIDEAVKSQIDEDYKPYGNDPIIRNFVVDGQPARVIYPSLDQQKFFKDKETAIVIKYPNPVILDNKEYDYVVIWASKEYVPLILSTFKFLNE